MKNYIDVKVTAWKRYYFDEASYMPGIVDLIKENGLEEVLDEQLGLLESEILSDTEKKLNPSHNETEATIEVYENAVRIWNNEPKL